jgi:hypothetical protein
MEIPNSQTLVPALFRNHPILSLFLIAFLSIFVSGYIHLMSYGPYPNLDKTMIIATGIIFIVLGSAVKVAAERERRDRIDAGLEEDEGEDWEPVVGWINMTVNQVLGLVEDLWSAVVRDVMGADGGLLMSCGKAAVSTVVVTVGLWFVGLL